MKNQSRCRPQPLSDSMGWMFGVFLLLGVLSASHHASNLSPEGRGLAEIGAEK